MKKLITKKELSFFELFDKFIVDSKTGKRLQPNGKLISKGTVTNYLNTRRLLFEFCNKTCFYLRIRLIRKMTVRELKSEKNYWKRFYIKLSVYLYDEKGFYDNYAGSLFKIIRVFFGYLNMELGIVTGDFYRSFYVRKEEIPIFPLLPE